MKPEQFDLILSPIEKEKINLFITDTTMSEAVRKIILAGIYYNGTIEAGKPVDPAVNFALQWPFMIDMQNADVDDSRLGQDVRASVRGIRMIEQGFKALKDVAESIKPARAEKPKTPNRGR